MSENRSYRAFDAVAIGAAALAALVLPGQQIGLNVALVWAAMVTAVWLGTRDALEPSDAAFVAIAIVPVALAAVRTATWVVVLQIAVALASVAVGTGRARGWISVLRAPARVIKNLGRGFLVAFAPISGVISSDSARLGPKLPAAGLSAGLLLVFGALFVSADAAFASLTEAWLVPDINFGLIPARVAIFLSSLSLTGALALLSPVLHDPFESPWALPPERRLTFSIKSLDWKVALVLLDLLFASFVAVQLTVLFGGHTHVLETTGLTYAEYAREGFFQLVVVAFLTLLVIAGTVRFAEHEKDRTWARVLLGILCALTLVILISAMTRMNLYQEAYGFTRMRLLVDLVILWLGSVFILILIAGAMRDSRWLPRAVVVASVVAIFGFGLSNPDARIAHRNVERFNSTGKIDLAYLEGLSPDALPGLVEFDHPQAGCVIERILARSEPSPSLWSFNLGRHRAHDLPRPPCNF